jgi:hypothetical protein
MWPHQIGAGLTSATQDEYKLTLVAGSWRPASSPHTVLMVHLPHSSQVYAEGQQVAREAFILEPVLPVYDHRTKQCRWW